jgi:hypothetical protein
MFYKQDPGGTEVTMESVLGKDCEAFVVTSIVEYRKIVPRLASTPHFFQDAISRTMLVLWLLRLYFRSCLDLWKWMEEKAQRYIKERLLADEQIRVEDFARIHLAKATFNLGHDPYKYLRAEDVATARGAPAFIQIPLPNSGTGSSATGIQTLVSLPAEPPNIANQDGTSPAQPQRDADFLTETTWDWKSLSAPNRDLTPTTSFRTETTSQQLPDDSMDFESTPAPSSDEKIRPGQPEAMAPFPHESTSTGHKNQDEKVTSLVTPRPTTPGRIVLEPTPTSSEILYTFRSEHENLIRRIAAEREARSSVGGEETEVPEDI